MFRWALLHSTNCVIILIDLVVFEDALLSRFVEQICYAYIYIYTIYFFCIALFVWISPRICVTSFHRRIHKILHSLRVFCMRIYIYVIYIYIYIYIYTYIVFLNSRWSYSFFQILFSITWWLIGHLKGLDWWWHFSVFHLSKRPILKIEPEHLFVFQ